MRTSKSGRPPRQCTLAKATTPEDRAGRTVMRAYSMAVDGHSFDFIAKELGANADPGEVWTTQAAEALVQLGGVSHGRVAITKKQVKRAKDVQKSPIHP